MVEATKVLFLPLLNERSPIDLFGVYTKDGAKTGCDQAITRQ